jgi:hypothetical protein
MKKIALLTSLLVFSLHVLANEINVETKVQDVIIYHSGALVNRVATTELKPGLNEVVFLSTTLQILFRSFRDKRD